MPNSPAPELLLRITPADWKKHAPYSAQNKLTKNTSKRLAKVLSDHDVALADVDAMWSEYHNASMQSHRDMLEFRYELKQHMGREEWTAVIFQ